MKLVSIISDLATAPVALVVLVPLTALAEEVQVNVLSVNDSEPVSNNALDLLAQQPTQAQVAQVAAVRLNPTPRGLEVILESAAEFPEVLTSSTENSLITDIPNAQLRLPAAKEFRQDNPTDAIIAVTVTNLDAKTIRVTVTGKAGVPRAEVSQSPQALILSVAAPPVPQPTPAPTAPSPTPTPEPEPKPQTQEEKSLELTVTAEEEERGYDVPDASTATRTDTPIRDIPASIQVVPQQVLRDQQVTRFDEALRNFSGVIYGGTNTTSEVRFSIRGFENAPVLIDGFRQFGLPEFPDPAGLERIEVLKGPASILYGEIQPGGVINAVTKKPLAEPFYEAELQIGSRNFFRPRIDLSGPLTSDEKLLYRLNALVSTDEGFQDFDENYQDVLVAPVLTWKLSDRTDLTVELQYQTREKPFDLDDTVALGRGVADIPRERLITEPDDDSVRKFLNVGYTLEHRFSDDWLIRNAFRYTNNSYFSDKLTIPIRVLLQEWSLMVG